MATPHRITCFGDSITHGKRFPDARRWTTLLQQALDTLHPGQYEVYNRGIGGNTVQQGLDRFEGDVLPQLPGTVLLEFGFNDGSIPPGSFIARNPLPTFEIQLAEVIRRVREKGGRPILLTNHPIERERESNQGNGCPYYQNFAPYQVAIRQVAQAHQVPLIDLEAAMTKANVCLKELLHDDGLHLSDAGNRIYADFVFTSLHSLLKTA